MATYEIPQGDHLVLVCQECLRIIMRGRINKKSHKAPGVRHDVRAGWGQDTRWRGIEENRWHHAREALSDDQNTWGLAP